MLVNCRNNISVRFWLQGRVERRYGRFRQLAAGGHRRSCRKMAEARLARDDYGSGAWRERLSYLRRIAGAMALSLRQAPDPPARLAQ